MKEKEFLEKFAAKRGITKKEAEAILDDLNALEKEVLKKEGELVLNDMGKYVVIDKPARMARNPMTGQEVKVPAKKVVKWRPNKKFKEEVLGAAAPKKPKK